MTMIACTMNKAAPIIIGDLLISSGTRKTEFLIPSWSEDVLQYLSEASSLHPIELKQKIYILKSNVCIAFSGSVFHFKLFLQDIKIFCAVTSVVDAGKMQTFLDQVMNRDLWKHFAFIILVIDKLQDEYSVGRFLHGAWYHKQTDIYDDVYISGSGFEEFIREASVAGKIRSMFSADDGRYSLQTNVILIGRLLALERSHLLTIKNHWGAGFETAYFNDGQFLKLDDVTYVINEGEFDKHGNVQVPIPSVVMNYKYHGSILVITVIKPSRGATQTTDTNYTVYYKEFIMNQFIVVPIDRIDDNTDLAGLTVDPSFNSHRNIMGYIIESPGYNAIQNCPCRPASAQRKAIFRPFQRRTAPGINNAG